MTGGTSATSRDAPRGTMHDVSRAGMDYTPPVRTNAIKAAGRHTARVKFLRRAFILGAVFCTSVIAIVAVFDPFRHLPKGISISGVGVHGTKITLDSPKLKGLQQGGGAYTIEAKTGIQDLTTPSVMDLLGVDAHIGMSDNTMTHILSNHGHYDSQKDTFALDGDVKIDNTSGYRFGLKSALVDFKAGTLTTEQRMRVDIQSGFVVADAMTIGNNGHHLVFTGHVGSTFESEEPPPTTAQELPTRELSTVAPIETMPQAVTAIEAAGEEAARERLSR